MFREYLPSSALKSDENLWTFIQENKEIENCLKRITNNGEVIMLFGNYGVGKDVWARMIQLYADKDHKDFLILRFADYLRGQFNFAGFTNQQIDTLKRLDKPLKTHLVIDNIDVSGLNMRDALIKVAETTKEKHGPDFYADKVFSQMQTFDGCGTQTKFVITDCRFDNEHARIVKYANDRQKSIFYFNIPKDLPQLVVLDDSKNPVFK